MKKIVLFFTLIITTISFAQRDEAYVDRLVAQKMAELELQQNPEYFFRKEYCDGNIQMFNLPDGRLCSSKSTYYSVYLFWKESDQVFKLQKFDNCGSFMPISINRNKAFEKILKEKQALISGTAKASEDEKVDDTTFGNMSVQSCHKDYMFVLDGKTFEANIKEQDLTEDSKDNNAKNKNSEEFLKLDGLISEVVKTFENNGKFFREN